MTEGAREIILSNGKIALVDPCDFYMVSLFNWYEKRSGESLSYAMTSYQVHGPHHTLLMHRLIMKAGYRDTIDHINHNGLDNRRCNLRKCTTSQNIMHSRKTSMHTSSIYKGVHWYSNLGRWRAVIGGTGPTKYIGSFKREIDAALAYDREIVKLRRDFAVCNFFR